MDYCSETWIVFLPDSGGKAAMLLKRWILMLWALAAATTAAAPMEGDVVGRLTVGYQGWFSCEGDGSPLNRWVHWGSVPAAGKISFELWPDVREFTKTYPTKFAPLGNGDPANLYSAYDDQVVGTHFRWMRENEIDCAALQRFGAELRNPGFKAQRDGLTRKVRAAAEANGRKFYVMYDLSGWRNFPAEIKADWTETLVKALSITASPAYARQDGRPVVCIWGIGFRDRPGRPAEWLDVIRWFKGRGCYVIGGVTVEWRRQTELAVVFDACDMITPWTVGAYRRRAEVAAHKKRMAEDLAYLDRRGIAYQPVLFPGFAWSNWNGGGRNAFPRRHGDFLWQQFAGLRELGIRTAYVAMFDEFDEGTAIAKAAEDASMAPGDQYFLTLDTDGVECSADFYLRLTRDGSRMIKGLAPMESTHPTPHRPPLFLLASGINRQVLEVTGNPPHRKLALAGASGNPARQFEIQPWADGHFRIVSSSGEEDPDDLNAPWDFQDTPAFRWKFAGEGRGGMSIVHVNGADRESEKKAGASARPAASFDLLPLPNGRFRIFFPEGGVWPVRPDGTFIIGDAAPSAGQEFALDRRKKSLPPDDKRETRGGDSSLRHPQKP